MKKKLNPSVRERLATIEALVTEIKDNHLKDIRKRMQNLSNRFWWLVLTLLILLITIFAKAR